MLRFVALFLGTVTTLFVLELWRPVHGAVIVPFMDFLAALVAATLKLFDAGVISQGRVLLDVTTGFGISIEPGCNGVEVCIILAAAILASRAPWRHKLFGIGLGIFIVQALNLVRIISLFYLGQWNTKLFEWAHLYLWQTLIMIDVLILWLLWLRWIPSAMMSAPDTRAGGDVAT